MVAIENKSGVLVFSLSLDSLTDIEWPVLEWWGKPECQEETNKQPSLSEPTSLLTLGIYPMWDLNWDGETHCDHAVSACFKPLDHGSPFQWFRLFFDF